MSNRMAIAYTTLAYQAAKSYYSKPHYFHMHEMFANLAIRQNCEIKYLWKFEIILRQNFYSPKSWK